jgi:hypothetical protein
MRVERHWWNGDRTARGRRDVFVRTDGERWEVAAQTGGDAGRSKVLTCPGRLSAEILAGAWMGGGSQWQLVPPEAAASPSNQPRREGGRRIR